MGSDGVIVHTAMCVECRLSSRQLFGRLSVFRSRHYGARLCPSFVLLVYLRYGASLLFYGVFETEIDNPPFFRAESIGYAHVIQKN